MDNKSPNQHKIYRSDEIIDRILESLGVQRTDSSEYKTYTVDGKLLRVRVSDHGVNLSSWYRNNQGEEIPLNDSDNIAFTFLPNKEECAERNEEFRTTVINKTTVYSDVTTKTPIDFEFTVMHYIYQSWKFTEERLKTLVNKIMEYTNNGKFEDPLQNTSAKATVFKDTSNNKPIKLNCNRNMKQTIKLTESDLRHIIKEALDELDPRTYASYAQGRQQQAQGQRQLSQAQQRKGASTQNMTDKAKGGRLAAMDAWNNKYGYNDEYDKRSNGTYDPNNTLNREMYGNPNNDGGYKVTGRTYSGYGQNKTYQHDTYLPNGQVERNVTLSDNPDEMGKRVENAPEWTQQEDWYKVQQQMNNPNPQRDYVKGQGWNTRSLDESISRAIRKLLR